MDDDATDRVRGEASPARAFGPDPSRAAVIGWLLAAVLFLGAAVAVGILWPAPHAPTPIHRLAPPASSRPVGVPDPRVVARVCSQSYSAEPGGISSHSPEITEVTALDRTTVRVRWVTGSAASDAIIIVSRVCENGRMINAYFAPHATEYVFRRLDPTTAPWCFRVEVATALDLYSRQRCISPPRDG